MHGTCQSECPSCMCSTAHLYFCACALCTRFKTLWHSYLWNASTEELRVSWEKVKTQVTSNASNETRRFYAVDFLEALLVGFNY